MFGENYDIYFSQMAKYALKLYEEKVVVHLSQITKYT